ncbi:MAG: phosphopyruvate hydratase [Candidatus Dojkabacteria bacterium]|jgi:enolase
MKIENIVAREILDSNGNPTIETEIELLDGTKGIASVPSGASTGKTEVLELRDGDKTRYNGKGVLKAVEIVNKTIAPLFKDKTISSQEEFDKILINADGTDLKVKLGGNSILSCSMAYARAMATSFGLELFDYLAMTYWKNNNYRNKLSLPTPLVLVLEGGKHGNWATDIQEYMVVPNMELFEKFNKAMEASVNVYKSIEKILDEKEYSVGLGFEGAFAPKEIKSNKEAFDIIVEGIKKAGYTEEAFKIAIDVASSEFYNEQSKIYELRSEDKKLTTDEWYKLQMEWYSQYPIISVEDPFNQDDWETWTKFNQEYGKGKMVVGDDLLTTNVKRIAKNIETKSSNAVLIKLNQIGTVTETLNAIRLADENGMSSIISHRSGETNDDFIADLVVATPAKYSKFGGPNRGERVSKYNRLLCIEKLL